MTVPKLPPDSAFSNIQIKQPGKREPLWKGPQDASEMGGITFSMLSRFIVDRERFRLYAIEGLKSRDRFNHRIEYGSMWHVCEEGLARYFSNEDDPRTQEEAWGEPLEEYATQLASRYPLEQEAVTHWYNVCKVQFPHYVKFWAEHPDVLQREPILQECIFNVAYVLPSKRIVRLRGKFDSVDHIPGADVPGLYLQENKTKGDVDVQLIQQQLTFDLQTMMYLIALKEMQDSAFWNRSHKRWRSIPVVGVRYNVVRRPLSGGKGTIVRHKATKNKAEETWDEYYGRLGEYITDTPDLYFMRWKANVSTSEINDFKGHCLNQILEQLCDWYEWVTADPNPWRTTPLRVPSDINLQPARVINPDIHWRHPFGVYNILNEGGSSEYDNLLQHGDEVGLRRVDRLFEELRV